jgi:hypothetical protein
MFKVFFTLTQLAYRFNWRTAKPLGPSSVPGCDEPTSRCLRPSCKEPAITTFGCPHVDTTSTTVGSLSSAFAPARLVSLAVKLAYAFTLRARFPSAPSQP